MKNAQQLTRGIFNKGVGNFRKLSPALRFTDGGYDRRPLFLTNNAANRSLFI